ncbi:MAG: type 1 glutamine amidotransferase domain-containing protein [Candidatus Latescibacterota bacterium]
MSKKKILVTLSEWGYWGEELVGPLQVFDERGYESVFMTPTGKRPVALPPSMDETYMDPPLGRCVTSEYYARKTRAMENSDRLSRPQSLREMFPERPYFSAPEYLREFERYNDALDEARQQVAGYDALLIVGGSGPMVDLVNNQRLHDVILTFHRQGKPIAAECYGVACLAFARDWYERRSLIWGKHVTGHPLEYDYKDGTGFMPTGTTNFGPPFYPLEFILRDAVGPEGRYHGNVGRRVSVVVDYPFITSRSTAESRMCGEKVVEVLENGLKRFGW